MSTPQTRTQECLLDAAEALFIEHGYAATSLRSIATKAEANLAATHYHFGSKEGLFAAVIHRRVTPLNEARLRELEALEARGGLPSLREILGAFFRPVFSVDENSNLPKLVGRVHNDPAFFTKPILEKEFGAVMQRFLMLLGEVLPELSTTDLQWRFHFLIGAMLHTLTLPTPLAVGGGDPRADEGFERLLNFAIAGLTGPTEGEV